MAFLGEIRMIAGNFPPRDWEFCHGQLLPISENDDLFNLIGTTYGGDGEATFALPDLRGRVPIHMGAAPGSVNYTIGEMGGVEQVTLTTNQMPSHHHVLTSSLPAYGANPGSTSNPQNAYPAISPGNKLYSTVPIREEFMADPTAHSPTGFISPTGEAEPHNNMQPYLCVSFIICIWGGVYPSQ